MNKSIIITFLRSIFWVVVLANPTGSYAARSVTTQTYDLWCKPYSFRPDILVIGKVSRNPRKHIKHLKPIVEYAASRLADRGIARGEVLFARDNHHMIQLIKQGCIDWITESVFSALIFVEQANIEILLKRWKQGASEFHSVFIARRNSGIDSLDDIKGKVIAFKNAESTTAFFLPVITLKERGIAVRKLTSPQNKPAPDEVGYVFANSEINISAWVHKGIVDAGSFSNADWNTAYHNPPAFRPDLKVFYRTKPVPRVLELVNTQLAPEVAKDLKKILLQAHLDPLATDILHKYQRTSRFEETDDLYPQLDHLRIKLWDMQNRSPQHFYKDTD